jgi:hypothetical protein
MTFPFDISHLVVRKYRHLGEDIGFGEVERMRQFSTTLRKTAQFIPSLLT